MKRSLKLAVGLAAIGLGAVACNNSGSLPKVEVKPYEKMTGGKALATVNGVEITDKDLDERINRTAVMSPADVTPDQKKQYLDELIGNEVLYQEAKAKGYSDHPRVKLMMVSLLQRDALNGLENQTIPDDQTKKYYDTHHDEFVIPEKVRARRILILFGADKNATKQKAEEIQKQAAAKPDDFGKIAQDSSEGPEKTRQGELGYFASNGRPGLDQKIVDTAFKLKNGEVSQVFENAEGWNIVKVENRAAQQVRTYDQVKKSIERKMLTDMRKAMLDNYIATLKNSAKVAVDDQALAAYTPTIAPKQPFPGMMMGNGMQPGMMPPGMQPGAQPPVIVHGPAPVQGANGANPAAPHGTAVAAGTPTH